jgi:transcriptional regulator with XRE-family HTH domain
MKKKPSKLMLTADAEIHLKDVGKLVTIARKKRKMTLLELSKRAAVDRRTLAQLEAGSPGVSIGTFFQVLSLLKLSQGLEEFLKPENDLEGAALQVRKIRQRKRSAKKINDDEVNF